MGLPTKQKILEALRARIQADLGAVEEAARAAHSAATHEESRAEDPYDTRGLEASYLAGAQAKRADELRAQLAWLGNIPLRPFAADEPIKVGALIEVEGDGRKAFYWLVQQGAGTSVEVDGVMIQVITPHAPLGEALLDHRAGDVIEVEAQRARRELEIVAVH